MTEIYTEEWFKKKNEELRKKEEALKALSAKPNSIVEAAKWGESLFGPSAKTGGAANPSARFAPLQEDLPPWDRGDVLIGGGPAREVAIPSVVPPRNGSVLFTGRRVQEPPADAYADPMAQHAGPAPIPQQVAPRHGRVPAPYAPPPATALEEAEAQSSWVPPTRAKTVPIAAADRPQGPINPGIDPSTLPLGSERLDPDNPDAELPFMLPKQIEGVNFELERKYRQIRPGAKVPLPIPGLPELRLRDIVLSSLLDGPEDKKAFFGHLLYPGDPHPEKRIEEVNGVFYHRGNDDRYYRVVPDDLARYLAGAGGKMAVAGGIMAGSLAGGAGAPLLASLGIAAVGGVGGEYGRARLRDWLLHDYAKHPSEDYLGAAAQGAWGRFLGAGATSAGNMLRWRVGG